MATIVEQDVETADELATELDEFVVDGLEADFSANAIEPDWHNAPHVEPEPEPESEPWSGC